MSMSWFMRFIRKVFAVKILLSGKFLLFLTLPIRWVYAQNYLARVFPEVWNELNTPVESGPVSLVSLIRCIRWVFCCVWNFLCGGPWGFSENQKKLFLKIQIMIRQTFAHNSAQLAACGRQQPPPCHSKEKVYRSLILNLHWSGLQDIILKPVDTLLCSIKGRVSQNIFFFPVGHKKWREDSRNGSKLTPFNGDRRIVDWCLLECKSKNLGCTL